MSQLEREPNVDVVEAALRNVDFRRVLMTGRQMQVALMTIPPGGEVGAETHPDTDQVLYFVEGDGEAVLDGDRSPVAAGGLVFVTAGTHHNFMNTGDAPLRIVTAYAPPEHDPGTVHPTKADADAAEDEH